MAAWYEEDHPRGANGQFASAGASEVLSRRVVSNVRAYKEARSRKGELEAEGLNAPEDVREFRSLSARMKYLKNQTIRAQKTLASSGSPYKYKEVRDMLARTDASRAARPAGPIRLSSK